MPPVPCFLPALRVSEEEFWRNYFSHVAAILHRAAAAGQQQQQLEQPAAAPPFSSASPAASSLPAAPTAAASAAALPASVPDAAVGSAVISWGVIGCGREARQTIAALQSCAGSRVVALYGRQAERAAAVAQRFSISLVHSSLAGLLHDGAVSAVYIGSAVGSTLYGSHAALALAAAEAGRPALVERPMARSAAEGRRMVAAFSAAGLPLLVHQPLRALPAVLALQQRMQQLRHITHISYSFSSSACLSSSSNSSLQHQQPLLQQSDASSPPPAPSLLPRLPRSSSSVSDGGPVLPLASDLFDLLEMLVGQVSHVVGDAAASSASPAALRTESIASCCFRCGSALGLAVWDLCSSAPDDRLHIVGTDGDIAAQLYPPQQQPAYSAEPNGRPPSPGLLQTAEAVRPQLQTASKDSVPPSSLYLQRVVDELRRRCQPASSAGLSAPSDVLLVDGAAACRGLECVDAMLRRFYRCRTDEFWHREQTWQPRQQQQAFS